MRSGLFSSAALLTATIVAASPLAAQADWTAYIPGSLHDVLSVETEALDFTPSSDGTARINLSAKNWPQRVVVRHTGQHRPLSEGSRRVIDLWAGSIAHDSTILARFTNEYRFVESGNEYWIPVQTSLEEVLAKEIKPGERVTLLTRWLGTYHTTGRPQWVFIVNEFEEPLPDFPASQWEVNGFLLGQHWTRVDSALGKPYRTLPGRNGVTNRVYIIDEERGSYMVFAVDSTLRGVVTAVQVTGSKGTAIRPFLGISFGTKREELVAKFGRPTKVEHQDDVNSDMWAWAGRNYTIEVDSAGLVNSIRISQFEGFKTEPDSSDGEPTARIAGALGSGSTDSLLAAIAPDIEFFKGGKVVSFTKAPRSEIEDARSPIRVSLKDVATRLRTGQAESVLRVQEDGDSTLLMTRVYKWSSGPIAELVFHWYPGGWRLWEVRYR